MAYTIYGASGTNVDVVVADTKLLRDISNCSVLHGGVSTLGQGVFDTSTECLHILDIRMTVRRMQYKIAYLIGRLGMVGFNLKGPANVTHTVGSVLSIGSEGNSKGRCGRVEDREED